jgi:ribosomal protein S18 acetylase RimI-like enzyme
VGQDVAVTRHLVDRLDAYLDAAPRTAASAEDIGPFTLFVAGPVGWRYYARPRRADVELPVTAADVAAVMRRQAALDQPQTFEWVAEHSPTVATACADAGLSVRAHPLLVHHDATAVPVPDGLRIRRLLPGDAAVGQAMAVGAVAFAAMEPGATGGVAQRSAAETEQDPADVEQVRLRIEAGQTVVVVAEDESGVLASGAHNPVGDATELVGIATLPDFRRHGLGAAVTDTLVADAVRRGLDIILLSAADDDVARIYERVGFRRVATAMAAATT